ncbi:MAG: hypothetical protein VSS75_031500 [Candidatus Parabeggiatoa sp.]|nr:hypothetical protein [Candidatus Parabeggiatoa sp.]
MIKDFPQYPLRYCSEAFVNFWRRYLRREPLRREASRLYCRDALRASLINRYFTAKGYPKVLPSLLVASIKIPENLGFSTYPPYF